MAAWQLQCTECGATYVEEPTRLVCTACAVHQQPGGTLRGVLEVVAEWPDAWPLRDRTPRFGSGWLPIGAAADPPAVPVGDTPLLAAPPLRKHYGMARLWLKDDTRNPSGSTKDRASHLVVAKAREYGLGTIATASTGNAATALAAIAAGASLRAVVFVPATAPQAKLIQMLSYGATVVRVDGSYDDAFELCLDACRAFGWYNRNTGLNPFTIEGKKTAGLEIAADLAPDTPDAVLVPTGDGVILAGVAKGCADLVRAGLLPRMPRMIAVQPVGSAAIVRAVLEGAEDVTAVPDAQSIADSLVVRVPRNARLCLRRIRESGGGGVMVSEDAILAAISRLGRLSGVFAEPAAAATLAGLDAALEAELVSRDECVVLLVTGTGLKDVGAASLGVRSPEPVAPTLAAVAESLERSGASA